MNVVHGNKEPSMINTMLSPEAFTRGGSKIMARFSSLLWRAGRARMKAGQGPAAGIGSHHGMAGRTAHHSEKSVVVVRSNIGLRVPTQRAP
jgi:hypothetical protein